MALEMIKVREKYQITLPRKFQKTARPGDYFLCEELEDGSIKLTPVLIQLKSGAIISPTPPDKGLEEEIKEAKRQIKRKPGARYKSVEEMNRALAAKEKSECKDDNRV